MKHYEFKNQIAGGAKPKTRKPKPATLKPPKLGDYKVASSYTYAEILDLISDGPIEGLVNKNGYKLPYNALLQGVYLNNVPVEQTNEKFLTEAGVKTQLANQSVFSSGIKDLFDDIEFSQRRENILYDYPNTESLYDLKEIAYSFNDTFDDSISNNPTNNLVAFENYPIDLRNQNNYPVKSPGVTYTGISGSDNFPIRSFDITTPSGTYDIEFSLGYKHVDDIFTNTSAENGLTEFLDLVYNTGNLYTSQYTRGKLLKFGYNTGNIADGIGKQNIKDLFANIYYEDIPKWYFDSTDHIGPYVCIKIDGKIEGYEFYSHVNYFLKKDEAGSVTTELNYDADFDFDSSLSSEGLNLSSNTTSMLVPLLATDGTWDGKVKGFYFIKLDTDNIAYYNIENGGLPSSIDSLVITQDQNELNYLRNLNGFILNDKSIQNTETVREIQTYYETYTFERILNYENCPTFSTNLVRRLDQKGYTSEYEVEVENNTVNDYVMRKGVQVKYSFKIQTYEPRNVTIPWDTWFQGSYDDSYVQARLYIDGELVDSSFDINPFPASFAGSLSSVIKPSPKLQTITVDLLAYADRDEPDGLTCPPNTSEVPSMGSVLAKIIRPIDLLESIESEISNTESSGVVKYNWSNILAEFRTGGQNQLPLSYFKDVHVDYAYNYTLLGPFNPTEGKVVQRLNAGDGSLKKTGQYPDLNFAKETVPEMDEDYLLAIKEGSSDERQSTKEDYAGWDILDQDFTEKAQPLTHVIENPNVSHIWFSLTIDRLKDTVEKSIGDPLEPDLDAGASLPGVVNIRVETGRIKPNGKTETTYSRLMQITALVEGSAILDIGNVDNAESPEYFDYINEFYDIGELDENEDPINKGGMFTEFELEPAKPATESALNTRNQEHTPFKRFIRITKLSTESNSTLVFKEIGVLKFTEIVRGQCQYPYSAYTGVKIDSRVFSEIPRRSYEAKLKKIQIPSNYFPSFRNGKDKRYYDEANLFSTTSAEERHIYKGDWDGTFKFAWSDNPAWILYDMILNERYGLGGFVEPSSVNKWDLYKIGRFCDSVDDEGYFLGLDDGRGGLEPRFSCNIIFSEETKIFDAINTIASIFRGVVYYNNSTIEFADDRPKEPIALFTNSNVKDGVFSYSNYQRDEQINTIEVIYIDRYDGYKSKIELVENQTDIAKRGIFKKSMNAFGITSKAMARRAGEHFLYQTTKENQSVSFTCGLETLLCKPGDLIVIDDDLKSFKSNFGRVLDVDNDKKSIRISNAFSNTDYEADITLYKPSEITDITVIEDEVSQVRSRLDNFTILNNNTNLSNITGWNYMLGKWIFEEYSGGYNNVYDEEDVYIEPLQEQYAIYKNDSDAFNDPNGESTLWFNTGVTGWVFSTGNYAQNGALEANNLFILEPDLFDFNDLQFFDVNNLQKTSLKYYNSAAPDKRGSFIDYFTGDFLYNDPTVDLVYSQGNEAADSLLGSNIQIFTVPVTGWDSSNYGDNVYVDKDDMNSSLIQFVPPGTPYRFKVKNQDTNIYKINSIKEEARNEYSVVAVKFDTGKYNIIDEGC
ncbi:MAG: hypothetical protein HWN81_05840 [Candidatus Lokiarchaeota archaeon]|nr:hypothetical protein [Candidatus Lokiarchaeota archaeon]